MTLNEARNTSPAQNQGGGIPIMVAATLIVPAGDAISKYLAIYISPLEIAFFRFGFQAVFVAIGLLIFRQSFRPVRLDLLAFGGLTLAATLVALITAFQVMPIATAIAIFFVEPLVLTLLSVWILGEKAGWRRYVAVAVGMCGALIVIRPNWAVFGWPALLPMLAAVSFALNAITVRKLSTHMSGLSMQFWFSVFALGLLMLGLGGAAAFGLFSFEVGTLSTGHLMMLPAQGLLSAVTFFLFTEAFRRSQASVLAPFQYIEIIGATLVGYMVFGDFPDGMTWLGTAIILASGIYVFHRERRQNAGAT